MDDGVKAVLERYGLGGARAVPLQRFRGKRKSLFRVASPEGEGFLLRLYETDRPGDHILRSEALWLGFLHGAGLSVPEPIPATDGSSVVRLPDGDPGGGQRGLLLRWMPGETRVDAPAPEDLRRAGSFVGRLHLRSERQPFPDDFTRPKLWRWERVFGERSRIWDRGTYSPGELGVFRAAAGIIRRDLEELGDGRDVFGVVHGDLNLGNYVFRDGDVGVIDFEHSGWGYYLHDLTTTLSAVRSHPDSEALQAAFLEGYRKNRVLPKEHRKYFGTFAAMRTTRRISSVLAKDTGQRSWSTERLKKAVQRLENFVEATEETGRGFFA